jgi:hypothetical protein
MWAKSQETAQEDIAPTEGVLNLDLVTDTFRAVGISDTTIMVYQTLLRYVKMSQQRGHTNLRGETRIWPSKAKLSRMRDMSERSLSSHLTVLEKYQVVRREPAGSAPSDDLWVSEPSRFLPGLLKMDGVREKLALMSDSYDDKVTTLGVRVDRNELLKQALQQAQTANAETHEKRLDREKQRREAIRQTSKPARKKNEPTAPELCLMLANRTKSELERIAPPITKKDWGQMARLRDHYGAEAVQKAIEYLTVPVNWEKIRRAGRISALVPTVGILDGYKATIFPLSEERPQAPRRSGGADLMDADDEILG